MSQISKTDLILNEDGSVYHLNLKPEHLSETIITVGDPNRVYNVSKHFDEIEFEMNKREFTTHIGHYKGKRITVISTGMGTGNIEIFFTELDALANVDLKNRKIKPNHRKLHIIRVGTSGALRQDILLGAHLVSDYAVGLDNLMYFYNLSQSVSEEEIVSNIQKVTGLYFKPYLAKGSQYLKDRIGKDMITGNTVTCPGFYAPQGREIRLKLKYPNLIADLNCFHHNNFQLTNFEMETAGYYALAKMLGHEMLSVNAIIANRITNKFSPNANKVVDDLIVKVLNQV